MTTKPKHIDERRTWALTACLTLLGSGCVTSWGELGAVDEDSSTTGEGESTTDDSVGMGPDLGDDESTGNEPADSCTMDVGASQPRVILRHQYENAVEDVLGLTPEAWSNDEVWAGLSGLSQDFAGPFEAAWLMYPEQEAELVAGYAAVAAVVAASIDPEALLPCALPSADPDACAEQLVTELGRRLWRRPLDPGSVQSLLQLYEGTDLVEGTRDVVSALLASSSLWVLQETGTPWAEDRAVIVLDDLSLATRMAFFLWSSTPDDALLAQAEAGALADPLVRYAEVERMLEDPRAERTLGQLYREWLRVEELETVEKDAELFPSFGPSLAAAMEQEIERFVSDVVLDGDARLDTLLTAPFTYVDSELLALYGADVVSDPGALSPGEVVRVELDPERRGGLFTLSGVLTKHSNHRSLSYYRRGLIVRGDWLCFPLPPPPPDVDNHLPEPLAGGRYEAWDQLVGSQPTCEACHVLMDDPNFAFDEYDPIGRWQTEIDGVPVQTAGELVAVTGGALPFSGRAELTQLLADLPETTECTTRQHLRFALRRELGDADACAVEQLEAQLEASDGDLRVLLRAVAIGDHFGLVRPM